MVCRTTRGVGGVGPHGGWVPWPARIVGTVCGVDAHPTGLAAQPDFRPQHALYHGHAATQFAGWSAGFQGYLPGSPLPVLGQPTHGCPQKGRDAGGCRPPATPPVDAHTQGCLWARVSCACWARLQWGVLGPTLGHADADSTHTHTPQPPASHVNKAPCREQRNEMRGACLEHRCHRCGCGVSAGETGWVPASFQVHKVQGSKQCTARIQLCERLRGQAMYMFGRRKA